MTPEQLQKKREQVNKWLDDVEADPFGGDPGVAYDLVALNLTLIDEIVRLNGEIERLHRELQHISHATTLSAAIQWAAQSLDGEHK